MSEDSTYSYAMGNDDKTLIATFTMKQDVVNHLITVQAQEGGNVIGGGTYDDEKTVKLTASITNGYKFIGWYDKETLISSDKVYEFVATSDCSFEALFTKLHKVSVYCPSSRMVELFLNLKNIDCSTEKPYISPEPKITVVDDQTFIGWSTEPIMTEQSKVTELTDNNIFVLYAIYGYEITLVDFDNTETKKVIQWGTLFADIPNENSYGGMTFLG